MRGRGHVLEAALAFVVEERERARLQDEQVRLAVVVVVTGHHRQRFHPRQSRGRRHVREAPLVALQDAQTARARLDRVERAVAVDVHESDARGGGGAERGPGLGQPQGTAQERCRGGRDAGGEGFRQEAGRLRERNRRRLRVHEVGLGPGGSDGFGIAALLHVRLTEAGLVAALPELLEAEHLRRPFFALPTSGEGHSEVVGRAHVVGLGGGRDPEGGHRFLELPLLQVDLPEQEVGPEVFRVGGEHPAQVGEGVLAAIVHARDEGLQVVGLRRVGSESRCLFRGFPGRRHVGDIEECDCEVDPGQLQLGIRGEGPLELLRRVREAELLEEGHAQVVRAIGGFAVGRRRSVLDRDRGEKEESERAGPRLRRGHSSILSGPAFQLKAARRESPPGSSRA